MSQKLGMPLHTENCGRRLDLDRFDVAIVIVGHRTDARPQTVDHLVVQRIDAQ